MKASRDVLAYAIGQLERRRTLDDVLNEGAKRRENIRGWPKEFHPSVSLLVSEASLVMHGNQAEDVVAGGAFREERAHDYVKMYKKNVVAWPNGEFWVVRDTVEHLMQGRIRNPNGNAIDGNSIGMAVQLLERSLIEDKEYYLGLKDNYHAPIVKTNFSNGEVIPKDKYFSVDEVVDVVEDCFITGRNRRMKVDMDGFKEKIGSYERKSVYLIGRKTTGGLGISSVKFWQEEAVDAKRQLEKELVASGSIMGRITTVYKSEVGIGNMEAGTAVIAQLHHVSKRLLPLFYQKLAERFMEYAASMPTG